jgi:hypothetical protein
VSAAGGEEGGGCGEGGGGQGGCLAGGAAGVPGPAVVTHLHASGTEREKERERGKEQGKAGRGRIRGFPPGKQRVHRINRVLVSGGIGRPAGVRWLCVCVQDRNTPEAGRPRGWAYRPVLVFFPGIPG